MSGISRRTDPVVAISCGDPAGVGPRAVLQALRRRALGNRAVPLLVGAASVWRAAGYRPSDGPLRDLPTDDPVPRPGVPTAAGGRMSAASFEECVRLGSRGLVAAVVTAPISKEGWVASGYPYRDHTERLAELSSAGAEMVLGLPSRNIWCVLATRHVPLAAAVRVDAGEVRRAAFALAAALERLGRRRPKLALCGLNPHAGEGGLLGREETVLAREAARLRRTGVDISDPLPADSAWRLHVEGDYDGVVCLYHDQALIPLKVLGGLSGVNWTVGLPFVRTSPAHGTGWDAARSGIIDPSGTVEALRLAARLVA